MDDKDIIPEFNITELILIAEAPLLVGGQNSRERAIEEYRLSFPPRTALAILKALEHEQSEHTRQKHIAKKLIADIAQMREGLRIASDALISFRDNYTGQFANEVLDKLIPADVTGCVKES